MRGLSEVGQVLPEGFRILWREEVGSTNDELRILAEQGAEEGLILGAERQSAGRGRRGRAWFSEGDVEDALTFSVLLRPREDSKYWPRYSLVVGLAVAEALAEMGVEAEIKWPNDLLVRGRKIAGILVEAGRDFVVIGVGVNVNYEGFPDGLEATSVRVVTGKVQARGDLLVKVMERLDMFGGMVNEGFRTVLAGVRSRDFLRGKQVCYQVNGLGSEGLVLGIGDCGGLMVEVGGRVTEIFQADEVRVVGQAL